LEQKEQIVNAGAMVELPGANGKGYCAKSEEKMPQPQDKKIWQ
jgi:hypothetical protein